MKAGALFKAAAYTQLELLYDDRRWLDVFRPCVSVRLRDFTFGRTQSDTSMLSNQQNYVATMSVSLTDRQTV